MRGEQEEEEEREKEEEKGEKIDGCRTGDPRPGSDGDQVSCPEAAPSPMPDADAVDAVNAVERDRAGCRAASNVQDMPFAGESVGADVVAGRAKQVVPATDGAVVRGGHEIVA